MARCLITVYLIAFFGLIYIKASSSDLEPLVPVLCPHDDTQTNTCYEMSSENRSCIIITFSSCNDGSGSSWHQHRHWWTHHICWTVQQESCTVYKCEKKCCEGWTTDEDGRCEKPFDIDDIQCVNGWVTRDEGVPKCNCRPSFHGERCDKPLCEGGCKNGGQCRVTYEGLHQCHCPHPFSGPNCESVTCLETCLNGGTCVSNGTEAVCACPPNFYGKTCKHEIDGTLCPMPNNTACHEGDRRDQCISTADCRDGHVCCSDGCRMLCMRPVTKTCSLGDQYYRAGEIFSKDSCNHCTCLPNGTITCEEIRCPPIDCKEGTLTNQEGLCCPVCKGDVDLPSDYSYPTLSPCYDEVVVPLNVSCFNHFVNLRNLHIEAWDYEGSKLQVVFSPSCLEHCRCTKVERTTQLISASAVDRFGGRTECNFRAYVLDSTPPFFRSCPADIYALEDEVITWDEPMADDNVGIRHLWSNFNQEDKFDVGEYTVTYSAIDYDDNQATCEFNVFVLDRDTKNSEMPSGLACRRKRHHHHSGLIAGTICAGVILVVLSLIIILVMRARRRRDQHSRTRRNIQAISNEQYGIGLFPDYKGSSTKPPEYTPPTNPPAYDELNNPDATDYKFANPPLYDELSLAGEQKDGVAGDASRATVGVYEAVSGDERDMRTVNNPIYGSAQGSSCIRTPRQTDV